VTGAGAHAGDRSRVELVERAVVAAAIALEEAQDELCRLDAAAGDGDEGLAMATAARAVRKRLNDPPPTDVPEIVSLVATELSAVGGAMGALSYVIVSAIGEKLDEGSALTAARIAEFLAAAEDGVSTFGSAKRGDKSILDAIASARDAAEESARNGSTAAGALSAAAAAAREGAKGTAAMEAKVGRASRLGARSRGTVDAGAESFAIVLTALADAYVSHEPKNGQA